MNINREGMQALLRDTTNGNYNKLAKLLNIDVGYLHKVINGKANGGISFVSKVYEYCKANDMIIEKYIFL